MPGKCFTFRFSPRAIDVRRTCIRKHCCKIFGYYLWEGLRGSLRGLVARSEGDGEKRKKTKEGVRASKGASAAAGRALEAAERFHRG